MKITHLKVVPDMGLLTMVCLSPDFLPRANKVPVMIVSVASDQGQSDQMEMWFESLTAWRCL